MNTIFITSDSVEVPESEAAIFVINSSLPVTSSFPINLTLSQTGQFIDNLTTEQTVTFEVGEDSKQLAIELVDDEILEAAGQLVATIEIGDDYVVADSPNNQAVIELVDDDTPILAITGITPIEEGQSAEFLITSTEVAQTPILGQKFQLPLTASKLVIMSQIRSRLLGVKPQQL